MTIYNLRTCNNSQNSMWMSFMGKILLTVLFLKWCAERQILCPNKFLYNPSIKGNLHFCCLCNSWIVNLSLSLFLSSMTSCPFLWPFKWLCCSSDLILQSVKWILILLNKYCMSIIVACKILPGINKYKRSSYWEW